MNYCSVCGSDQLDFSVPQGDNRPRYHCQACERIHYENPNMVVGCLVLNHRDELMLCRRAIEPRLGFWNLPCGFLENDETVESGALREVLEETGAAVELGPLQSVYSLPHAQQVYLIFLARLAEGQPFAEQTSESEEVRFFAAEDIPWEEIAFSSNSFAIKHWLQHREQPELAPLALGHFRKHKN